MRRSRALVFGLGLLLASSAFAFLGGVGNPGDYGLRGQLAVREVSHLTGLKPGAVHRPAAARPASGSQAFALTLDVTGLHTTTVVDANPATHGPAIGLVWRETLRVWARLN